MMEWLENLTTQYKKGASIFIFALLGGFLGGLVYANGDLTGHATDNIATPIADLTVVDAFFVKERDYQQIVGNRPLAEVKPEEFTPYTESFLEDKVRPIAIVKNRGTQSVSQRLKESHSPYTTCDLAGTLVGVRNGDRYLTTYMDINCADIGPGESRIMSGTAVNQLARPGKYCIDAVIDTIDTLNEWDESNNARHSSGCMNVPTKAHRTDIS
jgi:hypothetical protein